MSHLPVHVLIVAAGQGERFGSSVPKQYQNINDKPVLAHSIEAFKQLDIIKSITAVISKEHSHYYEEATRCFSDIAFAYGGKTRQESVSNGLNAIKAQLNDIVIIHDAARPNVNKQDIDALIHKLQKYSAASLALPVADSLRYEDGTSISRDKLYAMQTPQGFHYQDILDAHKNCDLKKTYTDDASIIQEHGIDVELITGSQSNIKITTQSDFDMLEKLMQINQNTETRVGTGFDVHAFETEASSRSLILCGIKIDHDRALAGHSDADVALHAITDALLGAIGGGDIGDHFPPTDIQYKDKDSRYFLEKTLEKAKKVNAQLVNIDLTIICEVPKIGPYKDQMKDNLAEISNLESSRINIKATTTEKLGFTGRGEGIASQAVVTVKIKNKE